MKNYIFIGGSGSGKSETAINFALMLSRLNQKEVHFFDMDQTKPLFRSREAKDVLIKNQIIVHSGEQLLDTPVIPHGVSDMIKNENVHAVLDLGGNVVGVLSIGQFSEIINNDNTAVYYVINCFRPFSQEEECVLDDISSIKASGRIKKISIICNPNFGKETTLEDVINGYRKTWQLLSNTEYEISMLCVPEWLYEEAKQSKLLKQIDNNIMKITQYIPM